MSSQASLRQYLVQLDQPISQDSQTGKGCYGAVYTSKINGAKCVVKKLHEILTGKGYHQSVSEVEWRSLVAKFTREIQLLSTLRHPNIVQFLGVVGLDGDPRDISLVMEQLDTDLSCFIESNKGSISLVMKLNILRDIACGVSHLHFKGIVHRDLNAGNVLLTTSLQAKVADLGVARIINDPARPQYLGKLSVAPGALDYMPPETLQENPRYGPELDCFSFGQLMLYFTIEVYPIPIELSLDKLDLRKGEDGLFLTCLQVQKRKKWIQMIGKSHPLNRLIQKCIDDCSDKRPNMKSLREHLEKMLTDCNEQIPSVFELKKEKECREKRVTELESEMKSKQIRVKDLESKVESNQKKITNLESEIESRQTRMMYLESEMESKVKQMDSQVMELKSEVENKQMQMNVHQRILIELEQDLEIKQKQLENQQKRVIQLESEVESKQKKEVELMSLIESNQKQVKNQQKTVAELELEVESKRKRVVELKSVIESNQKQVENQQKRVTELESEVESKRKIMIDLESKLENNQRQIENQQRREAELESEVESNRRTVVELKSEIESSLKQMKNQQATVMELESEIESKHARVVGLLLDLEKSQKQIENEQRRVIELELEVAMMKRPHYLLQKEKIQPLLSQMKLKKGDICFMIDQKWLKQWKKYVGYDSQNQDGAGKESSDPGPVDNSLLFEDPVNNILKDHLMEDLDYALLPKAAWEKLISWYALSSGTKPICSRLVAENGSHVKHLKMEANPLSLKLCVRPHIDKTKQAVFSRTDTIKETQDKIREMFEISEDVEVRLWQRCMINEYELMKDPDQSLADAGIYEGQMLMLECRSEESEWFGESSSCSSSHSHHDNRQEPHHDNRQGPHHYNRQGPYVPGLCGLSSRVNSCFMNSILQCLSNTRLLTEYFIGKDGVKAPYRKHINSDNPFGMKGAFANRYENLLNMIWSGKNLHLTPRRLKMLIGEHATQFSGMRQHHHDSLEFLEFALNALHEDLNLVKHIPNVDKDIETRSRTDEDIAEEARCKHLLCNQSVIVRLFQGQLKSTIICLKCEEIFRTFDHFTSLSLPLPTRQVFVYLVHSDPTVGTVKYCLTVPTNGKILELKQVMQKFEGIHPKNLVAMDVYDSRFHKIFYDKDQIGQIMDTDDIYLYELAKPQGDPSWVPIPVYMREIKIQKSDLSSNTTYGQLFGLPIVITVPRGGCTYRQLYDTIVKQIGQYVTVPANTEQQMEVHEKEKDGLLTNGDLFKMIVVNSIGSKKLYQLKDNEEKLKLSSNTYVSCDWKSEAKEKYYKKEKEYEEHESCSKVFELTIYDCLELFVQQEEHGEKDWYCTKCKESVEVFKKFDLWKLPEVLIIRLERFSNSRKRIASKVHFPLRDLDLSKYVINKKHEKPVYDLFAVTNHTEDGHYTAYCKNKVTEKWYSFDDKNVSEIDENLVCSTSSYMLFYACQSDSQQTAQKELGCSLSAIFNEELKQGRKKFGSSTIPYQIPDKKTDRTHHKHGRCISNDMLMQIMMEQQLRRLHLANLFGHSVFGPCFDDYSDDDYYY